MNTKTFIFGMLFLLSSSAHAELNAMEKYGNPAALEIVAQSATVSTVNNKSSITLKDVDKLVGAVSALHKTTRTFDAYPVVEFAQAWNSCNAMKDDKKLWNQDGINTIFIFNSGPDQNPKNTHLAKSPLITAQKDTTRTSGQDEGIAKLMLINAKLDGSNLTFEIKNGEIATGDYQRVRVITECVMLN